MSRLLKVCMVSGSAPPDACGVGDYTHKLAEALRGAGVDVDLVKHPLGLLDAPGVSRTLAAARPDVVHIQYPTVGFGAHLGPSLLSVLRPCVVTVHEASRLHLLRRLAMTPFSLRSPRLIFTTHHERAYAGSRLPWIRGRSSVIPVGSSIPAAPSIPKDGDEVVCFGLFRPQKGLEDVLRLAELSRDRGSGVRVRFIGSPDPRKMDYFAALQARAKGLPVSWDVGLSEEEVSRTLARARAAYMPFPDGAVDYRTSLLALLTNGVAVVTTKGENTSPALAEAVAFAAGPEEALAAVAGILKDEDRRAELDRRARAFARGFSWAAIAEAHRAVYASALGREAP